jgi:hypothetical protein
MHVLSRKLAFFMLCFNGVSHIYDHSRSMPPLGQQRETLGQVFAAPFWRSTVKSQRKRSGLDVAIGQAGKPLVEATDLFRWLGEPPAGRRLSSGF